MKLKEIAQTKEKAAALQNAINDTAEEFGMDADSLAKGKVKTAKMGGKFTKAQNGDNIDMDAGMLDEVVIEPKFNFRKPLKTFSGDLTPDYAQLTSTNLPSSIYHQDAPAYSSYDDDEENNVIKPKNDDRFDPYIKALNAILPQFRPSNAQDLDAKQLLGEMYALSNNQVEPVQAQSYNPQLATPYSVSLQDQMNEITAQTRAAQKMAHGNPSAQAAIAAQAYEAINKVKGEEFRMNQALADKVYTGNIAAMNDAKLKNLAIFDQQYTRQAQAKSNSKAVAQAALNSISDKYAKNALENKTLKTYENMYNYRYDAAGRLINMNPLQEWNTSGITSAKSLGKDVAPEGYEFETVLKKKAKDKSRNGSIVKAMRNL